MSDDGELITPDDPRFEGAEFISREAGVQYRVANVEGLDGLTWAWATWTEYEYQWRDPTSGVLSTEVCDHEHCVICNHAAFSESYEGDLREGWTMNADDRTSRWLCPDCFDRFSAQFGWTTAT